MRQALIILMLLLPLRTVEVQIAEVPYLLPVWTSAIQHYASGYHKEVIEQLKVWEGLVLYPYACPAGGLTIGYGHLIREHEVLRFGQGITVEQADSLLIADYFTMLCEARRLVGFKDESKQAALALLLFNTGTYRFSRSTLRQKIINDEPIDEEWIKWVRYRNPKTLKYQKSKHLLRRREYEIKLYNLTIDTLSSYN